MDEGDGGANPASTPNVCRSGSASTCLATRAVAILHSLDRGGADAGAGATIGAVVRSGGVVFGGGGADFGCGGVVFGCSVTRAPGGDLDKCLWSDVIVGPTAKPLLVWPGEGTKQ